MSRWHTVSVKHNNDSTESFTRFTSNGKNPQVKKMLIGSKGCQFDEETFWLCHDVVDAYAVLFSDTADTGSIIHSFSENDWNVHRHSGSLWTADVYPGPEYDWQEDVLSKIPDWVEVGGNWK